MWRSHRLQDMHSSTGGAQAVDPKPVKRYKDPDRVLVELLQKSNIEHQLAKESEKKVNRKWIRLGKLQSIRLWLESVHFFAVTGFKQWLLKKNTKPNQQQTSAANSNLTSDCHKNREKKKEVCKKEPPGPEVLIQDYHGTDTDNIDCFGIHDNELAIVRDADKITFVKPLPPSTAKTVTYGHNINPKGHGLKAFDVDDDDFDEDDFDDGEVHYDALRTWVLQVAFLSRLLIFALQALAFNSRQWLKHDNDGFKFTPEETYGKILDGIVNSTFGGYVKWDAHYFLHISVYGYTEDNFLAFFPLLPWLLYVPSRILYTFMGYLISLSSLVITLGVLVNTWLFVQTAGNIYQISKFQNNASNQLITTACSLFAFNPASIFFTGLYTETLFAYLTSLAYLSLLNRKKWMAVLYAGLSCLCQSTGILNFGFVIALDLAEMVSTWSTGIKTLLIQTCFKIVCSWLAFYSFEAYSTLRFCAGTYDRPNDIPPYCVENKQTILLFTLPYSYIQKKYWNVGFLQYFKMQIPNLVFAIPVLYVLGSHTWKLLKHVITRIRLYELKLVELLNASQAAHGVFLTVFCFSYMDVQESTRMIMASCPYLYVSMATRQELEPKSLFALGITSWYMSYWSYYFFGTILFLVGLPWT